ncbi:MAG: helix-turn-helix domain-containing protein [Verrucomicrobiae bacterium]|nr:helix-turn-helix domain-containing protein [Verrucomicrobiae bacterium]
MSATTDALLTPEQLAARWQVSKKTILNWCYAGRLPFAMHLGNKWRFPIDGIEAHERKHQVGRSGR